jgi:ATP phosphoribosyltransferase
MRMDAEKMRMHMHAGGKTRMHARCCRMPEWSETNPLRVVTGYHNIARKFFAEKNFEHVVLLSADGALEAAPLMGTADIILDLVRGKA